MTVCIAARSYSSLFLVSDRMITAHDIQFQPPVPKIIFLTRSIAVMASGDSAFHAEIMTDVIKDVADRLQTEPNKWLLVRDIVDLYIKYRNEAKLKRAEAAILAPLGLDRNSFLTNQRIMDSSLVDTITRDMIQFDIPDVSVIIAGPDDVLGAPSTHIYSIHNDHVSCDDVIGFRAIGSGARHAESQFMLAPHAWNSDTSATVLLAYRAKKDAEVAPGVGTETDIYMIGPSLGQSSEMRSDIVAKLDGEHRRIKKRYARMQSDANAEVRKYVEGITAAVAAQSEKPTTEDPEALTGAATKSP